jgi:hypothetical protein
MKAKGKGVAYLFEACLLARVVTRRSLRHIHNHISEASATVAMAAAELACVSYSLTEHGSGISSTRSAGPGEDRARVVHCVHQRLLPESGLLFARAKRAADPDRSRVRSAGVSRARPHPPTHRASCSSVA